MDKSDQKKERRFSQEQYEMLLRCSEKENMMKWNDWRKANLNADVLLRGGNQHATNLVRYFCSRRYLL